jgi:hypothetical protein
MLGAEASGRIEVILPTLKVEDKVTLDPVAASSC